MEDALAESIGSLLLSGQVRQDDAALVELASVFARQLDKAAAIRAAAEKALKAAEESEEDTLYEQVSALRAKVSERDTVDKIGARLLATLDALLMTPKARAAIVKGAPQGEQRPNPLDELREARLRRNEA